jgi:radical SAM superfamily enzyme YgiQ (UPF0313 family)
VNRSERRKLVYETLIKSGYTTQEARRLRDLSINKLADYIRTEKKSITVIEKVGKKLKLEPNKIKELKETANYRTIKEKKTDKKYLQQYNYIIEYKKGRKLRNKWTDIETYHMTISSSTKLYKYEVKERFFEWFDGQTEGYNALDLIKSSFKIIDILVKG